MKELNAAVKSFATDGKTGAIVLTGSERAFAGRFPLVLRLSREVCRATIADNSALTSAGD
jgi:enoyl-CoA hydratase/carnithine racemase